MQHLDKRLVGIAVSIVYSAREGYPLDNSAHLHGQGSASRGVGLRVSLAEIRGRLCDHKESPRVSKGLRATMRISTTGESPLWQRHPVILSAYVCF